MKSINEHLTDEKMLDIIAGRGKRGQKRAIAHLADCDRCRAVFGDWLRAVMPDKKSQLNVNVRLNFKTTKTQRAE